MKQAIHPTYFTDAKVVCSCGNNFITGSTKPEIRVEICAKCHPFFTGDKRLIDTLGRVEKFRIAQQNASQKGVSSKKKGDKDETKKSDAPRTLKEMLEIEMQSPTNSSK